MDAQIGQQMRKLELFYYSNPHTLVLTHLHWFWSGLYVLDKVTWWWKLPKKLTRKGRKLREKLTLSWQRDKPCNGCTPRHNGYDKGLVVLPRWCWRMRQGERRIHTKSYLACKDLGCAEHMHKCWMPQECSRLGEIRVGKVSCREPR